MPSRISIGDWRLPVEHFAQSELILDQLAGPDSPSYDQWVPYTRGGGALAAASAAAALAALCLRAFSAAAMRAAWLAFISASRWAIFSDSSCSARASSSRWAAALFFCGGTYFGFSAA